MQPVLTPEQMRTADEAAIAAGTPSEVLMERAGRAVAWATRRLVGSTYGKRVLILCGKGNNGGDGYVAGEVLRGWGARVTCENVSSGLDRGAVERELGRGAVVIDAMFGTGFTGRLEGDAAWAVEAVSSADTRVVAIDIPSGVNGLTGAVSGPAVRADLTVVMAALKTGIVQEPGRGHAGAIELADIGIDVREQDVATVGSSGSVDAAHLEIAQTDRHDVASWIPPPAPTANKWSGGGVLVVGGSDGMTGAPMLVSHAAMRVGAGIVWCAVPGTDAARLASGTEVITKALSDVGGGLGADAVDDVLEHARRFAVLVIGPGLGRAPQSADAARSIVAGYDGSVVLDADGLNAFEGSAERLADRPAGSTILTPHVGEYERLAGHEVGDDRIEAARALADQSNSVVLLKGPGTVIAAPHGRCVVNPTGTPALATAGSGDVLSGVIGGLLARDVPVFEAACAGAYLHGAAAETIAAEGAVASDLVAALPRTLARVRMDVERG